MVVSAVDSGSHEVCSARVKTDVLLVDVLLADSLRDEHSIGSQHETAKLGEQLYVSETCGNEDLVELLMYLLADYCDVVSGLVGAVGNSYAAGEVDEAQLNAGLFLDLHSGAEQDSRECGVVVVGKRVARKERMHTELLRALFLEYAVAFDELVVREAVLRVLRGVHYVGAAVGLELSARIVAAGDELRYPGQLVEDVDVCEIIEVYQRAHLVGKPEIIVRRSIGAEHDLMTLSADLTAQQKLGVAGAVKAAALASQDIHNEGVRGSLHSEVLLEALVPGKRLEQRSCGLANALLIIDVERRGVGLGDLFDLLLGYEWFLHFFCSFRLCIQARTAPPPV